MKLHPFYFPENDIFISVQKALEIYLKVKTSRLKNVLYDLEEEMR